MNELDPFQDYEVKTLNPDYSGTAYGVDFQRGRAVVYGLPQGATPEEVRLRKRMLLEMQNAGQGARRFTDSDDRIQVVKGPVYTISVFEPTVTRIKAKAS